MNTNNTAFYTPSAMPASTLTAFDLVLDDTAPFVTVQDTPVKLTRTEYTILKLLIRHSCQTIPKSEILGALQEAMPDCTETSLKQHISNLRNKLRRAGGKNYIEAVLGEGFRLQVR